MRAQVRVVEELGEPIRDRLGIAGVDQDRGLARHLR